MRRDREDLAREICRFKSWAAETAGEPRSGEWECGYAHWPAFYDALSRFIATVETENLSPTAVSELLYGLARDNECEHVGALLADRPELLLAVAKAALEAAEPDAKWQLCARLAKVDDSRRDDAEQLLLVFVRDDDEYVSRRALLALSQLQSPQVEALAERAWATTHQYQRIAALWALHAVASPALGDYLARARQDGREYLVQNAETLEAKAIAVQEREARENREVDDADAP